MYDFEADRLRETQSAFTKQQLARSAKFAARRDLLNALLEEDKSYSESEVNEILDRYLKGRVR